MKTKSASQSAFFNLRVLIGLFIVLAGVFLALAGFGVAQAQQKNNIITNSTDPLVPNGFDCSRIHELGIDKQENFRAGAIMIACGRAQGGSASPLGAFSQAIKAIKNLWAPLVYGTTDVDLVTGTETSPHVTQSETFTIANPDNPLQVLAAFNDSRGRNANPINISGASFSTDGGNTFIRLTNTTTGQSPFPGTEGDPVALYNRPTGTWFTVWLDTACGGQGLGGFKTTTPLNIASWTHFCVFSESSADRESGWADNNPASPFYGHMYISWNDFNVGGGALQVRVSTDNGVTWTQHSITSSFIRDVQITGDLATGDVYIAGMSEGGGGTGGPRSNRIFRSTDGGTTWTNTYIGPTFTGPSDGSVCSSNSYFAAMFTGYWRHMGWGEPAAINHVVHYVYAQHGAGSDASDVYYIRSTDSGTTFSAPLKLNTDATARPQWQPNLSVSPGGTVFATWYDARESVSCSVGNTSVPCYRMWSRKSNDNGVTWLPDDMFSDVVTPLPGQPDPGIVDCYAGDYDYGSAILTKHVSTWVDGRVAISGQSQQDAFTDREAIGCTPGWSAGGDLPSAGVRLVGVYFPANGKVYAMGGRASDSAGSEFTHPFEYDPGTNAWTTDMAVTYPDGSTNNMACGVLTESGIPYIYCAGGSQVGTNVVTGRVFRYNPVTHTLATVPAPWPDGTAGTLPGGFSIFNNKLYILGGFNVAGGNGTSAIWEFTPSPAAWVQKPTVLPVPLGYIPTTTIGTLIYTGGGSDITGGLLTDTTNSFVYNPMANTIGTIAPIPRATGETRALNFNGQMLVMGGGRTAPNPSNEVDAYTPGTNTWAVNSPVPAFTTARRNFPTDTNGTTNIWLAGGYASDNVTPLSSTEVFCAGAAPMASDAFSRKVHGGAGTFDIPLPLTGNVGVECRIGPTYQMIIDFPTAVTVQSASVTSGTGMVSSFSGSGTSQITVNLSGVTDVQRLTMTLHGVNNGNTTGEVPVSMGVLVGDVNGNTSVNASDVALTKSQVGQTVGGSNFREDVNANGTISATDVALVKSDVGHSLPP